MNRIIALHTTTNNANEIANRAFKALMLDVGRIVVFAMPDVHMPDEQNYELIFFPDMCDSVSKQKNFIIDWCKSQNFNGFLHIVEDDISFNERSKPYMQKLESTMEALDYDVHFSTTTDKCNYIFSKYCPRLTIKIDDEEIRQKLDLPEQICFTSHSNVSYITYNFGKLLDCPPKFDERFTIGMFYIIEFLARRKNTKNDDQLYFMNQYLSIADEIGAYDILYDHNKKIDDSIMRKENELFKSLNINYAPDNNLDIVLDTLYNKIKSKMNK